MLPDTSSPRSRRVALYWDFENVVLSRFDAVHGRNAWSTARYSRWRRARDAEVRLSDAKVDLGVVMGYAATLGTVAINRAYADWSAWWMYDLYRHDLLDHAVDLVQLFPLSGTKNGADIRLACDVVEDLHQHPEITDVVVVAGDSDFVGLAQRCRRNGRKFFGIGVDGHTARHLVNACDEFKFYQVLAKDAGTAPDDDTLPLDSTNGRELLGNALEQLLARETTGWVPGSRLEPMMLRLDPQFDWRMYGFDSFTEFLTACEPDLLEHRDPADGPPEYRFAQGTQARGGTTTSPRSQAGIDPTQDSGDYAEALRGTNISFSTGPEDLWSALESLPSLVGGEAFGNARDLQRRLGATLGPDYARDVAVAAIRVGGLFHRTDAGQRLRDDLRPVVIRRYVALGLADRIRQTHGHTLDEEKFTALTFGSTASESDRRIVQEVLRTPTVNSYAPLVEDVLRPPALTAVLESLGQESPTTLGSGSDVRTHLADAAEHAGFTLTEQDRAKLWSLLLEAGIVSERSTGEVERALAPTVETLLDALGRRVKAAGLPYEADLLARVIGV